ncbi:hypothetical protein HRG_012471 [Hirsutella rhossiliensis]
MTFLANAPSYIDHKLPQAGHNLLILRHGLQVFTVIFLMNIRAEISILVIAHGNGDGGEVFTPEHHHIFSGPYIKRQFVNRTAAAADPFTARSITMGESKSSTLTQSTDSITTEPSVGVETSSKLRSGERSKFSTVVAETMETSHSERWTTRVQHVNTRKDTIFPTIPPLAPSAQVEAAGGKPTTFVPVYQTPRQSYGFQPFESGDRGVTSQALLDPAPGTSTPTTSAVPLEAPQSSASRISGLAFVDAPTSSVATSPRGPDRTTDASYSENTSDWAPNMTRFFLKQTPLPEGKTAKTSVSPSSSLAAHMTSLDVQYRTSLLSSASSIPIRSEFAFHLSLPFDKKVAHGILKENSAVTGGSRSISRIASNALPTYSSATVLPSLGDSATARELHLPPTVPDSSAGLIGSSTSKPETSLDSTVVAQQPGRAAGDKEPLPNGRFTTATVPASSSPENDVFATNETGDQSPKQKATTAGIAMGAVGLGFDTNTVNSHIDVSFFGDTSSCESVYAPRSVLKSYQHSGQWKTNRNRAPDISSPVLVENTLSWSNQRLGIR